MKQEYTQKNNLKDLINKSLNQFKNYMLGINETSLKKDITNFYTFIQKADSVDDIVKKGRKLNKKTDSLASYKIIGRDSIKNQLELNIEDRIKKLNKNPNLRFGFEKGVYSVNFPARIALFENQGKEYRIDNKGKNIGDRKNPIINVSVGSDESDDIILKKPGIKPNHFVIQFKEGGYRCKPIGWPVLYCEGLDNIDNPEFIMNEKTKGFNGYKKETCLGDSDLMILSNDFEVQHKYDKEKNTHQIKKIGIPKDGNKGTALEFKYN